MPLEFTRWESHGRFGLAPVPGGCYAQYSPNGGDLGLGSTLWTMAFPSAETRGYYEQKLQADADRDEMSRRYESLCFLAKNVLTPKGRVRKKALGLLLKVVEGK